MCVVGTGLAGLAVAANLPSHIKVLLISESKQTGNSWLAQGGIAAALSTNDSPAQHFEDTMNAAAGHADAENVWQLVHKGKQVVEQLVDSSFPWDKLNNGSIALGREAAHTHHRIVHAGGDRTGALVMQEMLTKTRHVPQLNEVKIHSLIVENERCVGVRTYDSQGQLQEIYAQAIVLATGGSGALFEATSNSPSAVGTGLSLAFHAGAVLEDLEFIQFHPTILMDEGKPLGLLTEAVRGAGAVFADEFGAPLPINPLGARDQTSRAVEYSWQMGKPVYLDMRSIEDLEMRFPTVAASCQSVKTRHALGTYFVPVRPGAHFHMGGIQADLYGRTSLTGLYAVGEVASTGVHGANRLASNSLLECLVAGINCAETIQIEDSPIKKDPTSYTSSTDFIWEIDLYESVLSRDAGVIRSEKLDTLVKEFPVKQMDLSKVSVQTIDTLHRYTASALILQSAATRKESRGAHFRSDYPNSSKEWDSRVLQWKNGDLYIANRETTLMKVGMMR